MLLKRQATKWSRQKGQKPLLVRQSSLFCLFTISQLSCMKVTHILEITFHLVSALTIVRHHFFGCQYGELFVLPWILHIHYFSTIFFFSIAIHSLMVNNFSNLSLFYNPLSESPCSIFVVDNWTSFVDSGQGAASLCISCQNILEKLALLDTEVQAFLYAGSR